MGRLQSRLALQPSRAGSRLRGVPPLLSKTEEPSVQSTEKVIPSNRVAWVLSFMAAGLVSPAAINKNVAIAQQC
jgi:hypothetical protein